MPPSCARRTVATARRIKDQALIITYARDIERDELVEATRDQWQAQGILQREPQSELDTDASFAVAGCPAGLTTGVCPR